MAAPTYEDISNYMKCGASVTLTLSNGEQISRFRTHDILQPNKQRVEKLFECNCQIRGIVWPDHGDRVDRSIELQTIVSIVDENLLPYIPQREFFSRNPIPDGYAQIGKAPSKIN